MMRQLARKSGSVLTEVGFNYTPKGWSQNKGGGCRGKRECQHFCANANHGLKPVSWEPWEKAACVGMGGLSPSP